MWRLQKLRKLAQFVKFVIEERADVHVLIVKE